ncbi:MAG TPA: sigma-70 family RNA polymerase sigma factor [Thermoanaerobaculia bacterium]|nr:sigma-70 family RNA polymerase sigma factor [Thermoanaerobaculia bacterium]
MTEVARGDPGQGSYLPAVAMGDRDAFERLYDRYAPAIYAFLVRILGDTADAQEVLQETFVQIWGRAASYDSARGSEIAWLVSISRSRAIDRLRSRRTREARENEAAKEISNRDSYVVRLNAADAAVVSQEREAVRQALGTIPENQRVALELSYFEGLSQSEIAVRLDEPLGTIKTRMQLGMKKLKERLESTRGLR